MYPFFLNKRARDCAYFIDREEEYKPETKVYSCGIIDAKFFAPVVAQMAASALIFSINLVADVLRMYPCVCNYVDIRKNKGANLNYSR